MHGQSSAFYVEADVFGGSKTDYLPDWAISNISGTHNSLLLPIRVRRRGLLTYLLVVASAGLMNTHVQSIIDKLVAAGIGSREDSLVSIIPALLQRSRLPDLNDVMEELLSHAKSLGWCNKFQVERIYSRAVPSCPSRRNLLKSFHSRSLLLHIPEYIEYMDIPRSLRHAIPTQVYWSSLFSGVLAEASWHGVLDSSFHRRLCVWEASSST
jgi:hypothetical protein